MVVDGTGRDLDKPGSTTSVGQWLGLRFNRLVLCLRDKITSWMNVGIEVYVNICEGNISKETRGSVPKISIPGIDVRVSEPKTSTASFKAPLCDYSSLRSNLCRWSSYPSSRNVYAYCLFFSYSN